MDDGFAYASNVFYHKQRNTDARAPQKTLLLHCLIDMKFATTLSYLLAAAAGTAQADIQLEAPASPVKVGETYTIEYTTDTAYVSPSIHAASSPSQL